MNFVRESLSGEARKKREAKVNFARELLSGATRKKREANEFHEGTPCLTGVGAEAPAQGVGVTE